MPDTPSKVLPEPTNFPFHHEMQARFADLDPNDHVNNVAVAGLFSEGRSAFLRRTFSSGERPTGFHFVVGQVAIRYVGEARWPNLFTIGTGVLEIGIKSLRLGQAFFIGQSTCALAEAVLVARQDGRTAALSKDMRDRLSEHILGAGVLARQLL